MLRYGNKRWFSVSSSSSSVKTAAQLRESFLSYFERNGHTRVASSSVIPTNDPTLLFTNAGMVQFKDCFLGIDKRPYNRAASSQKCIRAGGKHNDLENVGHTARHHTFFEMLGSFSLADYFREEAIFYAWEFITKEVQLPKDRLGVSVHELDEASAALWKKIAGLDDTRIRRLGDADNRWSMGDGAGPCGPCTEIFWDQQALVDGDRWLEIWNVVFMEEYKDAAGKMTKLERPCIDTGMGLERLASIVQGKPTNFGTDIFEPVFDSIDENLGARGLHRADRNQVAAKVLADHVRSCGVMICDGIFPSNVGRGYVLRRIIRRAVRYAYQLGVQDPFLFSLFPAVATSLGEAYPDLVSRKDSIMNTLKAEEEIFLTTLGRGMKLLQQWSAAGEHVISAEKLFLLHDSLGFPADLTATIAQEQSMTVNMDGFDDLMKEQKERSRRGWVGSGSVIISDNVRKWKSQGINSIFVGYDTLTTSARVLAVDLVAGGNDQERDKTKGSVEAAWVALDKCPFYAESGGQIADGGVVELEGSVFDVVDCQKAFEGCHAVLLHGAGAADIIAQNKMVLASVDPIRRAETAAHHTATHILHSGLRKILGPGVRQAGSYVSADRLRLDISFPRPVTSHELSQIEKYVNLVGLNESAKISTSIEPIQQAIDRGAIAQFNDKYDDHVRVVTVQGFSMELCGGTHTSSIRNIFPFKILAEYSVSAGTRRIEAVCGRACLDHFLEEHNLVLRVASSMAVKSVNSIEEALDKLQAKLAETEAALKVANKELFTLAAEESVASTVQAMNGLRYALYTVKPSVIKSDRDLRSMAEQLQAKNADKTTVTVVVVGNKVIVKSYNGGPHAGQWMQSIGKALNGKGGGDANMAMATFVNGVTQQQLATHISST